QRVLQRAAGSADFAWFEQAQKTIRALGGDLPIGSVGENPGVEVVPLEIDVPLKMSGAKQQSGDKEDSGPRYSSHNSFLYQIRGTCRHARRRSPGVETSF